MIHRKQQALGTKREDLNKIQNRQQFQMLNKNENSNLEKLQKKRKIKAKEGGNMEMIDNQSGIEVENYEHKNEDKDNEHAFGIPSRSISSICCKR